MKRSIALILFSAVVAFSGDLKKLEIATDTVFGTDLEIPFGTTLVIRPGVRVQFEGYRTMVVRGLLIAEGTSSEPILFTSVERARGSREKPAWKGIEIIGKEAHCNFKNCRFEGAFRNLVWESSPSFDSCQFAGNHYALYCTRKALPHIKNCKFYLNTYGVAADNASPLLMDNIITENVVGLYLQLSSGAIVGKNTIDGNETNIRSEDAFGENKSSMLMQHMWELMEQLF